MNRKVANRYSKAIYELALDNNAVDSLINDVNSILNLFEQSNEFRALIVSPVINTDEKESMLNQTVLSEKFGLNELTHKLIQLLLKKKRITLLEDVCFSVLEKNKIINNIVDAKVESAISLDDTQLKKIKAILESRFNKTVNILNTINEELIGGMRITVDGIMIDHSIQTHIAKLRYAMVEG